MREADQGSRSRRATIPRAGLAVAAALVVLAAVAVVLDRAHGSSARPAAALQTSLSPPAASRGSARVRHYEYVFPDGAMYVYDIDHGQRLVQVVPLPGVVGVRGVAVSPRTHTLYVSYGSDGGPGATGHLLAYDLVRGAIAWRRTYSRGIDSMAIAPGGGRIYMPDGALSPDGVWSVIDAATGDVVGQIDGGRSPHDTIVDLSGKRVYLGGRNYNYLEVASTATDRVIEKIGPLRSGVRPFTINGRDTLAYTTATGFSGFQVSSIRSGHVLYTVTFGRRFSSGSGGYRFSAPSHGISLSPNERQVWVIDSANNYVHVFDVSRAPRRAPRRIADIRLRRALTDDGWLQHSRSGCLVYVGSSGDVLSTRTFRVVGFVPALRHSQEMLEIDWRRGAPVATSSRAGVGYVRRGPDPPNPRCRA